MEEEHEKFYRHYCGDYNGGSMLSDFILPYQFKSGIWG
jgi:hypothetical protein